MMLRFHHYMGMKRKCQGQFVSLAGLLHLVEAKDGLRGGSMALPAVTVATCRRGRDYLPAWRRLHQGRRLSPCPDG